MICPDYKTLTRRHGSVRISANADCQWPITRLIICVSNQQLVPMVANQLHTVQYSLSHQRARPKWVDVTMNIIKKLYILPHIGNLELPDDKVRYRTWASRENSPSSLRTRLLKIKKEGLVNRLGWKCTLCPVCRRTSNWILISILMCVY